MILALLAAAAAAAAPAPAAPTPVADAERAFAAMAQSAGQWTAFRAFMAPGAIRLTPAVTPAADALAGLADPPHAIEWLPARTLTSCDGSLALSTGPWRLNGATGHFYTIWQRQPDGAWKWLFDGGTVDKTVQAMASRLTEQRSECGRRIDYTPPPARTAGGLSTDKTLFWGIYKAPPPGGHSLRVLTRAGGKWVTAVDVVLQ